MYFRFDLGVLIDFIGNLPNLKTLMIYEALYSHSSDAVFECSKRSIEKFALEFF